MNLRKSHVILVVLLILAVFPPAFIAPIDWVHYQITGANYVDITIGMIGYFLYLPIITVVMLLVLGYRTFIKKLHIKENLTYILTSVVLLMYCIIRFLILG